SVFLPALFYSASYRPAFPFPNHIIISISCQFVSCRVSKKQDKGGKFTFDSFGSKSFEDLYKSNGGQAGTYTRPSTDSTEWTRK
ncbi:MAG: hypothetical protein LBG07_01015, partial [Treponema sp.]|nr:hypothetical protein [Treponema sp.]